jgi:hypothetical protein
MFMSSPEPITPDADDRHSLMLRRLAALSLELAEDLQARALAAETAEEAKGLAEAFHKVGRGLRQTLALELKVIRFRKDLEREANADPIRQLEARQKADARSVTVRWKKQQICDYIEPLIYNEHEDEEHYDLQTRFNAWLNAWGERPDFEHQDLDGLLLEACEVMGFDPGLIFCGDENPAANDAAQDGQPPPTPLAADSG